MPLREPLKWTGGIRESASGLIVELRTDEGLVGIGEAPGPTLPAIQAIIDREFAQFLVDEDPLRTEWLVHRLEEYSRNWAGVAAYAIAGVEMALLDLKGKAFGVPVAELLGGYSREQVPVIGYLFIDEPEANAQKAADFVAAGHTELKLKVGRDLGQDYDSIAAIRDRVGSDVKLRIDANMNWSVPAAIKWIRALEGFDLQFVEQPVPDFDIAGLAQVRRSVSVPIAADESCTSLRSALELIKADACDVFVVYPSEAGGLTRALQIARAGGRSGQMVRDRQLGRARRRDDRQRPSRSRGRLELPVRQRHALSIAAARRPYRCGRDSERLHHGFARSRFGCRPRRGEHGDTLRTRAPRVAVLRRHSGRRPECRTDPLREGGQGKCQGKISIAATC